MDSVQSFVGPLLPIGDDALRLATWPIVVQFDDALRRGNLASADLAAAACSCLANTLNGGTHFGVYGHPDAPWPRMERLTAAPFGVEPIWGQCGTFAVAVNGMASWIEYRGMYHYGSAMLGSFHFHAIDPSRPYISETGFRSYFIPRGMIEQFVVTGTGFGVADCARKALAWLQFNEGVGAISHDSRLEAAHLSRFPAAREAHLEAIRQAPTAPKLPKWRKRW